MHLPVRGVEGPEALRGGGLAVHCGSGEESQPIRSHGIAFPRIKVRLSAQKGFNGSRRSNRRVSRAAQITFSGGSRASAVWPYAEGKVRGISLAPLYKGAPKAALQDPKLYGVLALCDAIRSGRAREGNLAVELLEKEINV